MDEGFPSPHFRSKNFLGPRPPSHDERAKSSPGMSRTRLSDQTGLGRSPGMSPRMSPRMLRSAGSTRPQFTGRPVTAAAAFGGGGHRGSVEPKKDDIVSQAILFAQTKVSSYGMGESSLLSTKFHGSSKMQEKLEYQQRLVAHLKQQVATLHIHGQRLLYQNKELKRKVDLLQSKLEEEYQSRQANEIPQEEDEDIVDETLQATPGREDRAIQVPSGNFENIATAKTRLAAFLSSAVWTWKFTDVSKAICTAAGVQNAIVIARNPASGALVSSDDQSVGCVGSLFRLSPADQSASLAKASAEAGLAIVVANPSGDARYNIGLDIQSSKVEQCCVTSVPILYQGKAIGVIQTLARHRTAMQARDLEVLQSLAKVCVEPLRVRLENEQRLVDLSLQLKSVAAQVGAVTAGNKDLPLVASLIELQVKQLIGCDDAHFVWLDRSSSPPEICRANPAASSSGQDGGGEEEEVLRAPLGGLTGECLSSGVEQYVARARQHPLFAPECDGVEGSWNGSLLLLTLRAGPEGAPGMGLRLVANRVQGMEGLEQHLLSSLQGILSIVLSSLQDCFAAPPALHAPASREEAGAEEEERGAGDEEALSGLHRFCQRLARQVAGAVGGRASRVGFYTVDTPHQQVCAVPYPPLRPEEAQAKALQGAFGHGLSGSTAASGKGVVVARSKEDARFDARFDAARPEEQDAPSLWLPMTDAAGRVQGVLSVFVEAAKQAQPGDMPFGMEEVAAIRRIADHHAAFFAEIADSSAVEDELELWKRVAIEAKRPLEALDFGAACEGVQTLLQDLLRLSRCQLYIFDHQKQVLRQASGQTASKELELDVSGTHLICVAARSGEVVMVPRAKDDRSGLTRRDLPAMPGSAEQAQLLLPVVDSGGLPMMALQGERGQLNFSALEREVAGVLQRSAALALEHARFAAHAHQHDAAHESLAGCLTIEAAMRKIIHTATRIAKCQHAVVFWPSPEGSMCLYYLDNGQVKMKHFYTTQGIAASCLVSDKVLLLTDARQHHKFHPVMDGTELAPFQVPSGEAASSINAIYHPILDKTTQQPKAVLCVRGKKKGLKFNRTDVMAVSVFAKRVTVTLCNVEKHEGVLEVARSGEIRTSQMSHLNSIRTMQIEAMRKLSTRVKLNTVAARMTHTMATLLGVEACKLHVIEEGGKLLRTLGNTSMQDKVQDVAKAPPSDIVARVAKSNETILFDLGTLPDEDIPAGVAFEVDGVEMHNSLTVPLRTETGQAFAVLQFLNKLGGSFDGSDELVVHMAASAFETVLDTDALDRLRFDIGLGNVNASAHDLAGAILDKAVQLVPADTGQVLLLVEGGRKMMRHAEIAVTGERVRKIRFLSDMKGPKAEATEAANSTYDTNQGLAGAVIQTRSTINVPNIRKDPRFDPTIDLKSDFSGHSSLLCCPLVSASGHAMGVVQLAKSGMSQFTAKDVQVMQVLSTQAGSLLFNHDKHEESVSETVSGILSVTSSILRCLEVQPSVDVIVNRIADRAINVVPCENAAVLFKGREDVWTQIAVSDHDAHRVAGKKASRTIFAIERHHKEVRIPLTNGIIGEAFSSRAAVEIANALVDTRVNWSFEALCVTELRNMLVIPIFRNRHCGGVGLLVLVNKKDHPSFLHDDARRLDSYKEAISAAVHTIGHCRSWKLQDLLDVMRDPEVINAP